MTIPSTDRAIRAKLAEIFRATFELSPHTDVTGFHQGEQHKWDSLAHALLIAAIENEFGITIDAGDSLDLTSFAAMERYLAAKVA